METSEIFIEKEMAQQDIEQIIGENFRSSN